MARYEVSTIVDGAAQVVEQRTVDQSSHRGDWIGLGPYPLSKGWLRLTVHAADPQQREITAGVIHLYCPAQ